ncbi:putative RNA-directed DNA polymerase [Rosa chinensis]|uniref:Putative RNA-directed DNA polymerase n=1 Tax=Rosa chinensis TaxID=74649 RepID=A0A2P6PYW3_ROSCH|nr:putative RNA-directed DNA polymerase [Rosa chinensis]
MPEPVSSDDICIIWHPQLGCDQDYNLNAPSWEVEKFNGKNNFKMWQVEVCDVLAVEGLVEALDGKPSYMKQAEWKVLDQKACSILRFYMSKKVKQKVMAAKSAKEILEKLGKIYLNNSFNERILKMQLYKLRMDERTTSMQEHVDEFNRRVWELSGYDVEFSDEDKVAILLASLPEKYNDLVMGMMYGKDSVVFDHVVSLLLYKESKNAEAKARVTKDQSCGGSKSSRSSNSRNYEGKECYYCHEI